MLLQIFLKLNVSCSILHNRALHVAARKPDFPVMVKLLKLGADPLMVNSEHRTPLQLIAIKVN